jgi:hypothetical protein
MSNGELFEENLKRWELFSPDNIEDIRVLKSKNVLASLTESNELNFTQISDGKIHYYHSNLDPSGEAREWFQSMELEGVNVLYVYGVGAGFYYDAAKEWLQDENHFLVFLEDDPEVIHRLFETVKGKEILNNKQVRLEYFISPASSEKVWVKLAHSFGVFDFNLSALNYYRTRSPNALLELHAKISFWNNILRAVYTEYRNFGQQFYANFYSNLSFLPKAYRANNLFGKFAKIPAIICGAGPSLDKNLAILETLADKAIIFAGGTAINAVNSNGFIPHFTLGIDPNIAHQTRVIMNTAYEAPYIYRSRINHGALKLVHGPKLYVTGSGGYETTDWYEKELGIEGKKIEEGFNVINFSLSLAHEMGCNPIIFVGLDLAYSGERSYQSGVSNHPIHSRQKNLLTKSASEDLIIKNDIYGNPVYTLWKWVTESLWLSGFVSRNQETLFINATEGGIGIPNVLNLPLEEVNKHFLLRPYDLRLQTFGEVQNSKMPPEVSPEKIYELNHQFFDHLTKCHEYCMELENEYQRMADNFETKNEGPDDLETEKTKELQAKLKEEIGYKFFLNEFDLNVDKMLTLDKELIKFDNSLTPQMANSKKASVQVKKYKFLNETLIKNIQMIQIFALIPTPMVHKPDENVPPIKTIEGEHYSFENYMISIKDPELDLDIQEQAPAVSAENAIDLFYPNNTKKLSQFYLNAKFHGPVTFYSESGTVLAQNWYVHGLQQGKSRFYYSNGAIYSIQRYKDGVLEGPQEYYFTSGRLKSKFTYKKGKLHGDVWLYHPNGKKMRELHFIEGKRHGFERMWNEYGLMIIEVEYDHNRAKGMARTWYDNGQISREIAYNNEAQQISMRQWSEDGKFLAGEESNKDDYFDTVTKQMDTFTHSLDKVYENLHDVAPLLLSANDDMKDSFEKLKLNMDHLHILNEELLFESGVNPDNVKETLWKTPQSKREMQKKLGEITQKLQSDISYMQDIIKKISENPEKK